MTETTSKQAAGMAGCSLKYGSGRNTFTVVERDSRLVGEGCMFVGIAGNNTDGNRFAASAYDRGCRVFMMSSEREAEGLVASRADADIILTEDPVRSLQLLARSYIAGKKNLIKAAVTGSTGKTTTKEMLSAIFSVKYRTISNVGNYNNEIGLPLTALRVEDDTEAGVFEMGMEALGEIRTLADIIRPDIAAITNIGVSHLEKLGSRQNIMKAKMEITSYMDENSVLVINSDDDMLSTLGGDAPYELLRAGRGAADGAGTGSNFITISDVRDFGTGGISFKLTAKGETAEFTLSMPGVHNAWNASLAAACGLKYGISLEESAKALNSLENTGSRLKVKKAEHITVIDDTYNASPDSMRAALDVLGGASGGRRAAVLGDMLELGPDTDLFHREIGKYAAAKADVLLTVGEKGALISEGASESGLAARHFADVDSLLSELGGVIARGDTVLVKASNSMGLNRVSDFLIEHF